MKPRHFLREPGSGWARWRWRTLGAKPQRGVAGIALPAKGKRVMYLFQFRRAVNRWDLFD